MTINNNTPQDPSSETAVVTGSATPKKPQKPENWRSIASTIAVILIAPLFALFLTVFVFQAYQVDGPSMQTTLEDNDRLVVWKIPRTWARITGHPYIPNRGDVVVFTAPRLADFGESPNKQLIKRVIGLPGERVVVKDGVVTVYNSTSPNGFQPDATLPYGSVIETTNDDMDIVIPAQQLFVMGDNRSNSLDSRSFGPIEANNIVGKLILRVLPIGDTKRF